MMAQYMRIPRPSSQEQNTTTADVKQTPTLAFAAALAAFAA
jgi:hypothetical protein